MILTKTKRVGFFGGEPFLELGLIKRAVNIFKNYDNNKNSINIGFTTNGIY